MSISRVYSKNPIDSNIYLLQGDRNVLVDTGTGLSQSYIVDQLEYLLGERQLDSVVLTHCHIDHVGGLKGILDRFGSTAYAMMPDSEYIRTADPDHTLSEMFGLDLLPQPVTDLSAGQVMDIGAHKLRIIPTPGHTEGGLCLHDTVTGALFSGDTMFCNGVGRTDFVGGDYGMLQQSIRSISNIDISGVYPGHGDCSEQYGSDCVKTALRFIGD